MTLECNTIVILPVTRPAAGTDLLEAIKWGFTRSYHVLLYGHSSITNEVAIHDENVSVVDSGQLYPEPYGFRSNEAIVRAVRAGMKATQYLLLSEDCLLMRRGFDGWLTNTMQSYKVGLLGVGGGPHYVRDYQAHLPLLDRWGLPCLEYTPSGSFLADGMAALSGQLVQDLFARDLLTPENDHELDMIYGVYLSWAAQMLGYYQLAWGSSVRHAPPIYVGRSTERHLPSPDILSPQFALYHSVRSVEGYHEPELRALFKMVRGEARAALPRIRPVISPQLRGPAVTG